MFLRPTVNIGVPRLYNPMENLNLLIITGKLYFHFVLLLLECISLVLMINNIASSGRNAETASSSSLF